MPVELLRFGLAATIRRIGPVVVREASASPDGGVLADYVGPVSDPAALAARLEAVPGLVGHGLFPPDLVDAVLVGRDESVEQLAVT